MNHTPPIFINHGKKTVGYFSISEPEVLIIFVHGFNGDATKTWDDFPTLIKETDKYKFADAVFYGYDSLKGQANSNALMFYDFLKEIAEGRSSEIYYLGRTSTSYRKIVIVAHSLGSIIVRRALMNANKQNKFWLSITKMILFAPAHKGARIPNLIRESLPGLGKFLAGVGFITIPVLDDLRPESQTIKHLIRDTEELLQNNQGDFTIAQKIVWAHNEIVVYSEDFCKDPIATLILKKTHTKVCKPVKSNFLEPFEIVTDSF